jgi:tRNA pseudouridine38-40 synthase
VSFDDRAFVRFEPPVRHRYFVWVSFDGTAYHGWQIQPNGMSVQQKVQQSLSLLLRQDIEVTGAGRTDAGVHARQMVCHFDWHEAIDAPQLAYRLNRVLPRDISCEKIEPVAIDLHARYSATRRTYRYFVHTQRDPFLRHYSMETHWPLDFDLMNQAAVWLLQVKDFKAFCKAGADNKTTLCDVMTARWVQTSPTTYYFEIAANRFLRNMVRAVVGTLIDVGRHRLTLEAFKEVVQHGTRSDAGESMPAHALFLWSVEYNNGTA